MEYTPEMLAMLQAQVEYMSSDDRIKERAAPWIGLSPAECFVETMESCDVAAWSLGLKDEATLERLLQPEPLPADTVAILQALQRG